MLDNFKTLASALPQKPGIYRFYSQSNLLYIGKANSLRHRVLSYIQKAHNDRLVQMMGEIDKIEYVETNSAVEALILEAKEILAKQPPLNILLKDDKSFIGVYISKEPFPRIFPARLSRKNLPEGTFYGPYTSAKTLRQALKIIRKIFGYCEDPSLRKFKRPCFYYHLNQCPGVCVGKINETEYKRQIRHLILFLQGKKGKLLQSIKTEMKQAAKLKKYEEAGRYKYQLESLEKIHDASFDLPDDGPRLSDKVDRIEGYDISNVSGQHASGSMVVMECRNEQCQLVSSEYRRFNIRTVASPDDIKMIEEILIRRLKHSDWEAPSLFLIDGGKGHLAVAKSIVKIFHQPIRVIAMAKGPTRKKADLYGDAKEALKIAPLDELIKIREEAHRFAISGYRQRHRASLTKK